MIVSIKLPNDSGVLATGVVDLTGADCIVWQLEAPVVFHINVEEPPAFTRGGFAVNETVGGVGGRATVYIMFAVPTTTPRGP